jgi:hypothetical protein
MELNNTVIYYTANMENPEFEEKIRDNLVKNCGNLPIISVSRKPINLGKNICVGEQPVCYANSFRQILIGLKEAKTKYCIAAESDVLYPPEYFTFTPPTDDNVYRYTNLWVHFDGRSKFYKKSWVEAAQMCNREYWIKCIERVLDDFDWQPLKVNPPFVFEGAKDEHSWSGENPVLYWKTRQGIGFKTGFKNETSKSLPFWGTIDEVKQKYL